MKYFKNIKEIDGVLTFELHANKKFHKSLANALRRIIISDTPVIAIDKDNVTYLQNTTVLNNEILSKRLALIPFLYEKTNKKDFQNLEITLKVNNETDDIKDIFVENMEYQKKDNEKEKEPLKDLTDFPDILFTKLKPFQSLELIAKLVSKTQAEGGAEFCPTAVAIFTYVPDDTAFNKAIKEIPKDLQKDFTVENRERIYFQDSDGEPSVFQFTIETVGQIPNKILFKNSFDILMSQLDRIVKGLMEGIAEIIHIEIPKIAMVAYDFVMPGEGDTIGNLLQYYILKNDLVSFSGFENVHPLKKILIVRTALEKENTLDNNKKVFIETITEIKKLVMELKKDF